MKHYETLKKYGYPLFFYVGDTFINRGGNCVKIVTVEKEKLRIQTPSGIFEYKPLNILKKLVNGMYENYKHTYNPSYTAEIKRFNLPINEKENKKLCHYLGLEYSDDLKRIKIYRGGEVCRKFKRETEQNCCMEYIRAVLAVLPDVNTTDKKSSLNSAERNELLDLAIEIKNLKPSERLKKTISNIYTVIHSDLYRKLKGYNSEEKAKNFLNDRDIEFGTTDTIGKAFTYIEVRNLENLKKRIQKLDSSLRFNNTEHNVNEVFSMDLYNKLRGHDSIKKTINLLNSWELSPKEEKYPKAFQEVHRAKKERILENKSISEFQIPYMENQNEELNQDLLLLL